MKIALFYECGKIKEVGTGHKYRSREIGKELIKRGHDIEYTEEDIVSTAWDILVIDHIKKKKDMIMRAKQAGIKTVLIDGHKDDADLADLSVSAFLNRNARYTGMKYIIVPRLNSWEYYSPYKKSDTVLVSMGGYDANNLAEFVLEILDEIKVNAIVTKSINHGDFREKFSRVEIFEEDNYYTAMHECIMAITNGGLTFFQALRYGMPTIPIAQYEHQNINIDYLSHCCFPHEKDAKKLKINIEWMMKNEYYRKSLSLLATHFVDGKGTARVCDLIECLI